MWYGASMKPRRSGAHVVTTKRYRGDKTYRAHLLMRSYREAGKVRKETLANLTPLGDEIVDMVRAALKGQHVTTIEETFNTRASHLHGHVQAVLTTMKQLEFERLLASRPSRERSLVVAMVAQQVLNPKSKLGATRAWHDTSLPHELSVADASEDELYSAMDWLVTRKDRIERKLADRHLTEGSHVLYDLSSSYVEGEHCTLAEFGYNRDKKRGKKQVNYGLLGDREGRPIAVDIYPGNTSDQETLMPQVDRIQDRFSITSFVLVGDRGMITSKHITSLKQRGVDWITALNTISIKPLIREGVIQPSLFEKTNLFELQHDAYPGERLIACHNPVLGRKRAHKRQELLAASTKKLAGIKKRVQRGTLKDAAKIGQAVGKTLEQHKMGKHIHVTISEANFEYQINQESVNEEAKLDGIYIIRTSVPDATLTTADAVRAYKDLTRLEEAFKTFKSVDLHVRPIHHRLADRVKAHIFICMLAYYLRWHMEKAWAPLTFKDDNPPTGTDRDPVTPAKRSPEATAKTRSKTLPNGEATNSFKTLLDSLQTIVQNTHYYPIAPHKTFTTTTEPNPHQQRALDLLDTITL